MTKRNGFCRTPAGSAFPKITRFGNWTQKFNVSKIELAAAVKAVGNGAEAVKRPLSQR